MALEPATRKKVRARAAIAGPSGSGKTATALFFANALAKHTGKRIAVIDTQGGQSLDYVDTRFAPYGFDIDQLDNKCSIDILRGSFSKIVSSGEYGVCIIDSFSTVWSGKDGILDQSAAYGEKESFSKWRELNKPLNGLITEIQRSPLHVIVTLRVNTEWVHETYIDDKGKQKTSISKVGLKPVQKKEIEYEFSTFLRMDEHHVMTVERTSCEEFDRRTFSKPDESAFLPLIQWMERGRTDNGFEGVIRMKASSDQIRRYYEMGSMLGLSSSDVDKKLFNDHGIRIEQASEDFMTQKIETAEAIIKSMGKQVPK